MSVIVEGTDLEVDVDACGAVVLGPNVVCDGFRFDAAARVQSHIHSDHLHGFDSSKGCQQVLASVGTRDLLVQELNADLPYRANFQALEYGLPFEIHNSSVTLLSSEHMLGASQVVVEYDGLRLGYSGDFSWPLERVPRLDVLVVDSTYGSPASLREYSQQEADEEFISLLGRLAVKGNIRLLAHRGTLQRALQLLSGSFPYPIIGSSRLLAECEVYRKHGIAVPAMIARGTEAEREASRSSSVLQVFGAGDRFPSHEEAEVSTVKLSAFLSRPDQPLVQLSDRAFTVALSDHADFNGTLEYVAATGARNVVVDNARGPHGVCLALELRARLGINSEPSSNIYSASWGGAA